MFPECVCEDLAQNTPQIIFYSSFKLPLLGYEPKRAVFVFVPLNANELVLLAPFSEEGGASKVNAPAGTPATHNNLTHWNYQKLSSDRLTLLYMHFLTATFLFTIVNIEHQWKQAETMVALATLALQSAKKSFQKGNLKTKYEALTLSGSDVRTRSVDIDPSFRIRMIGMTLSIFFWYISFENET